MCRVQTAGLPRFSIGSGFRDRKRVGASIRTGYTKCQRQHGTTAPGEAEVAREREHSGLDVTFLRSSGSATPAASGRTPRRVGCGATLRSPVTQFSTAMRPSRRIATVNTGRNHSTTHVADEAHPAPSRRAPAPHRHRHYSEITPPCALGDTRGDACESGRLAVERNFIPPDNWILRGRRLRGVSSSASVLPLPLPLPPVTLSIPYPDVSVFPDSSRDSPEEPRLLRESHVNSNILTLIVLPR